MSDPDEPPERLRIEHVTSPSLEQAIADLGIAIVTTRRGRSGERRWFQCPGEKCGRRCGTLYFADEGLVCSGCAGLSDERSRPKPRAALRQQPTNGNVPAVRIERNHVVRSRPPSTTETKQAAPAIRPDRPPRQLVDAFRRITVGRVVSRFGLPVRLDDGSGLHVCQVHGTHRFVMLPTAQRLGGVRWWFRCDACQQRCGLLYAPASAREWDVRCRKCWNLTYRSQRR